MGLDETRMEIKASLLQMMACVFKCRSKKAQVRFGVMNVSTCHPNL